MGAASGQSRYRWQHSRIPLFQDILHLHHCRQRNVRSPARRHHYSCLYSTHARIYTHTAHCSYTLFVELFHKKPSLGIMPSRRGVVRATACPPRHCMCSKQASPIYQERKCQQRQRCSRCSPMPIQASRCSQNLPWPLLRGKSCCQFEKSSLLWSAQMQRILRRLYRNQKYALTIAIETAANAWIKKQAHIWIKLITIRANNTRPSCVHLRPLKSMAFAHQAIRSHVFIWISIMS